MAALLSEQLRSSIREEAKKAGIVDPNVAEVYRDLNGLSDADAKEYIFVNRDRIQKNMPVLLDKIESFQSAVSVEPQWNRDEKIDYEKITGNPNALGDDFFKYNMKDMDYFGSKVGMTGREFMRKMADDKTAHDRKQIAHGEDEGGWFESPKAFAKNLGGITMSFLAPRTQEAIERGEDPTLKDRALDVTQDALYAMPWSKGVNLVAKGDKTRRLLDLGSNAITPFVTEALDAVAYDENNPRGDFSIAEGLLGTSINIATPKSLEMLLRVAGPEVQAAYKNVLSSYGAEAAKNFLTNEIGDALYSDKKLGQVPMRGIGGVVNIPLRAMQDYLDEEEDKKKRAKAKDAAYRKWLKQNSGDKGNITRKLLEEEPEEE